MTSTIDLTRLRNCLSDLLPTTPVKLAYVYGSLARGQATSLSDLDLAIITGDKMDSLEQFHLEMGLEAALERLGFPQADAREATFAPPVARGRIVTEGILIYCRDEKLRVQFETSARREYFDLLPFLKQYSREYFRYAQTEPSVPGG